MFKVYLSRRQTRAMSIDHPIGDPTGGPAYRELRDPVTAIAASTVASVGGSLIGGNAAGKAAQKQADAAGEASAQQLAQAMQAIEVQQDMLNQQLVTASDTERRQIEIQQQALQDQLAAMQRNRDEQLAIAAQTRDAQLGIARDVLGRQEAAFNPYKEAGLSGQNRLLDYLGISGNTAAQDFGRFATAEFTPEAFAAGQDPGYAFRMKEGLKAVDAQAAARGGLISGAALKASQRFGQDMASQEYQNAYNRFQTTRQNTLAPYQQLQGVGLTTAGQISNVLGNYGQSSIGALGGYGTSAQNAYANFGNVSNVAMDTTAGRTGAYTGAGGQNRFGAYGNCGNQVTGALTGFGNAQAANTMGAGNALASGYVGQANAVNQGISGATNAYYQNQMLNLLRTPEQRAIAQYGEGNVYLPGGGGATVPSGRSYLTFD